ncbi:MAG: hypothetical protein ACFBZ9_15975 [Sphingomonadales bacterium]
MNMGKDLFAYLNSNQQVGDQTPPQYGVPGLSSERLDAIEKELGFPFPPDFRFLFENVSDPGEVLFPWSNFDKSVYKQMIDWVWRGIKFDIEHNDIWLRRWGVRSETLAEAIEVARLDFVTWPPLLPIYGHRFLPARPTLPDNPVFSIKQTDIIYYGANLAEYLVNEFVVYSFYRESKPIRQIEVWSDLAEGREGI